MTKGVGHSSTLLPPPHFIGAAFAFFCRDTEKWIDVLMHEQMVDLHYWELWRNGDTRVIRTVLGNLL
jgi:hypothetical protein